MTPHYQLASTLFLKRVGWGGGLRPQMRLEENSLYINPTRGGEELLNTPLHIIGWRWIGPNWHKLVFTA